MTSAKQPLLLDAILVVLADSFQIATRRQLAAHLCQLEGWILGKFSASTTTPQYTHQPNQVKHWRGFVESAANELSSIDDIQPVIYTPVDMSIVHNKRDVQAHMVDSFFKTCNLVLEPDGIVLHVPKAAVPSAPLACAPRLSLYPINASSGCL